MLVPFSCFCYFVCHLFLFLLFVILIDCSCSIKVFFSCSRTCCTMSIFIFSFLMVLVSSFSWSFSSLFLGFHRHCFNLCSSIFSCLICSLLMFLPMSMVAITVNRYVLIAFHGYYRKIYTYRNIIIMLFAVWTFSFGMIFPPLVDIWGTLGLDEATFSCTIKKLNGKSPKKFLFLVAFLLPSISISLCYSAIFYKVRSSRIKLESHNTPVQVKTSKRKEAIRNQRLEDLKLTKMMLTIFLLFMICFLPLMLVNVLDDDIKQPSVHIIASVLAWMSATINPIIYSFLNKHYQKAFRTLLGLSNIREKQANGLSCYSLAQGLRTPESSKSSRSTNVMSSSARVVELKYFSQTDDFSIVNEDDVHTQKQLQCMDVMQC